MSNPPNTGIVTATSTNHRSSLGTRISSLGPNSVASARSSRSYHDAETEHTVASLWREKEKERKVQLYYGFGVSGLNETRGSSIIKNTETKKLLGRTIGNVDAPVEVVKKAGIWVLARLRDVESQASPFSLVLVMPDVAILRKHRWLEMSRHSMLWELGGGE